MLKNRPQMGSKMEPKWLLEASWRGQKSVRAAFGLLEASWEAPGGPPEPKQTILNRQKTIRIGPWPARGRIQDPFQRSRGPKKLPGRALNRGPNVVRAESGEITKNVGRLTRKPHF